MEDKYYLKIGRASELTRIEDRYLYRFLEIFPGLISWSTIFFVILFSWLLPFYTAIFIIVFDIYWFFKTVFLSLHMRSAFNRMKNNLKKDWLMEVKVIKSSSSELDNIGWQDVYHLIILPMYKEPLEVVRHSFLMLSKVNYPLDKLIVVLATEERAGEGATKIAEEIDMEFGGVFFNFLITKHPKDIIGEIAGKGSNDLWAVKEVKNKIIGELKIPYENIIVSVLDVDTAVHPEFFGRLTHAYLTSENPLRSSFQPIPIFTNNIWAAPAFARVFAFSTTFWQMIQQSRPERLITFSSQSIGL